MYVSMTGFGGSRIEKEWGTLCMELSSVNHRYQEVSVRLPRELSTWEPWFHKRLRECFRRGKLSCRVEILWVSSLLSAAVDENVIIGYYRDISRVRDSLGLERDVSLDALIGLPGVLDAGGRARLLDDCDLETLLGELVDAGISAWERMRHDEGRHLKEAIAKHLEDLKHFLSQISNRWVLSRDLAFDAMKERVKKALDASGIAPIDDARFAQEALLIADRWDILEELDRLESHLLKFEETGDAPEPVGRKLDFLVQEMNREINTISSKVLSSEIRWVAVEAKTALERVREQIQNLE